jgi:hypothetical protein
MKRSVIKELIKRSMREVAPKTDSGAMTPEEEKMVADYEEEEANKHALDSERPMEEASSKSAEILNRPAGHMTFEQMGMIIMLADAVGENRGADEFLSKVSSKKEADRYIQSLIAKDDGKEGVMNESMDLPDDIKWDVEEVLDYYDNYSADLIVHGYSPSTGKTYGGSVVGTEAGGGDWDFFEGDIEAIEEMPDDDDILAEAEKIVAAWAQKQTIKEADLSQANFSDLNQVVRNIAHVNEVGMEEAAMQAIEYIAEQFDVPVDFKDF